MRRKQLAVAVVLALGSLPAAFAAAAEPAPPPIAFLEVLEVGVVNLEVVVTDRRGNRIYGLGAGDFQLFVDGEPVSIDYFTEVSAGVAAAAAPGESAVPGATAGEPVGTSYLVFIDDFFSIEIDRDRVLEALDAQLGLLGPKDRMAVVAWDGNHLTMLTSWSSTRATLERALADAAERPADGLHRLVERTTFERDHELFLLTTFDGRRDFQSLDLASTHYIDLVLEQVERATSAATSTLRAFATPPGRKVMLLLSGGWPTEPVGWAVTDPRLADRLEHSEELLETVVHNANLLGYTLYPVDVPGMSRESPVSADRAVPALNLALFDREHDLHYTLHRLAGPTGGKPLLDSGREKVLEEVTTDTRSYYWLGFSVDRKFDEKQHRLRVEVKGQGMRVRHREGFQDFSRRREVTMAVESALLFGSDVAQRPLQLQLGAARRAGIGKIEVPIEVSVPVDDVTFLQTADGWTSYLELRIAVLDGEGRTAEVPVVPVALNLADKPEAGTFVPYSTSMRLRKEPHEVLVSLYDAATGAMLSSRLEIDPR